MKLRIAITVLVLAMVGANPTSRPADQFLIRYKSTESPGHGLSVQFVAVNKTGQTQKLRVYDRENPFYSVQYNTGGKWVRGFGSFCGTGVYTIGLKPGDTIPVHVSIPPDYSKGVDAIRVGLRLDPAGLVWSDPVTIKHP